MKTRQTQNFLVIGTAHLGLDKSVLAVMNNAAEYYDAEVVHVGPLATVDEVNMWRRRMHKLRTWENKAAQKLRDQKENLDFKYEEICSELALVKQEIRTVGKTDKLLNQHEKLSNKLSEILEAIDEKNDQLIETKDQMVSEIEELEQIQWGRITALREAFGSVTFVCNSELCIPEMGGEPISSLLDEEYIDGRMEIGAHLYVTAVPANGDKVSGEPITKRTFTSLAQAKSSHIIPHMTPNTKPFPRPGLNQSYNFLTTGALYFVDSPKKITEAYKGSSRPSCVLVSLDVENGEFHPQRLRVKLLRSEVSHRLSPHIIYDGLVFDAYGNTTVLDSKDRGLHQTDMHAPHFHLGVIGACRSLGTLHQPGEFIDGGDTGDMESVSPFNRHYPGRAENLRLSDDLHALGWLLDAVANPQDFPSIKKRTNLDSNHHEWLTKFVDENPTLVGLCDWETISQTRFPHWDWYIRTGGDDKFYEFGDLVIKHGDGEGSPSQAAGTYGNYIAGHHHRFHEHGDAVFVGPGCKLGPKYLQNRATSWQNQLTTLTKYKGVACKHPKTILHSEDRKTSRFVYSGQIYEVPFYKEYKKPTRR